MSSNSNNVTKDIDSSDNFDNKHSDAIQFSTTEPLNEIRYLCKSNSLITESLQKGYDVTQLANGNIIVTKVEIVSIQYFWDAEKNKMIQLGHVNRK